jgi:hypothetical protein
MSVNIIDLICSNDKEQLSGYWVPSLALNWTICRTFKQKVKDCVEVWKGEAIAVNWKENPNYESDSIGMTFYE